GLRSGGSHDGGGDVRRLSLLGPAGEAAEMSETPTLLLGSARGRITPPIGLNLAGYGFRDRGSDSILDELELRAFWLQERRDGGESPAAVIVTADIIGFGRTLTEALRLEVAGRFGVSAELILLAASHTHSGPATCEDMFSVGGDPDP